MKKMSNAKTLAMVLVWILVLSWALNTLVEYKMEKGTDSSFQRINMLQWYKGGMWFFGILLLISCIGLWNFNKKEDDDEVVKFDIQKVE